MAAFELNNTILKNSANLKAYYRFESGALTTDSSGNGKTLTNNNSVAGSTGVYGDGGDFGASNSNKSLTIADNIGIDGGSCSISAWIKLSSEISSGYFSIASQQSTTSKVKNAIVYNYNGGTRRLEFWRVKNGISVDGPTYTITLGTSNWYHVALAYDGANVRGYINGQFVGVAASSGNGSAAVSSFLNIGCDDSGNRYFSGLIDDVAIFNTALSADQIKELYEGRTVGELWPQNGLVGLWHLNGNSTDYSGSGYNLTNNGSTPFVNGKFGQAGSFNGSSQSFSILNASCPNLNITGSQTWMCWFKTNVNNADKAILSKHDGTNYRLMQIGPSAQLIGYFSGLGTNSSVSTPNSLIQTGRWYFMAWIYDLTASKIKLWVDMNKYEATATGTTTSNSGDFRIGNDRTQWYFNGLIDEVAVFNRALSDREIRNYYAWATGRFGNIA